MERPWDILSCALPTSSSLQPRRAIPVVTPPAAAASPPAAAAAAGCARLAATGWSPKVRNPLRQSGVGGTKQQIEVGRGGSPTTRGITFKPLRVKIDLPMPFTPTPSLHGKVKGWVVLDGLTVTPRIEGREGGGGRGARYSRSLTA
eukprot:766691-Hanusia_phi.AAC.7